MLTCIRSKQDEELDDDSVAVKSLTSQLKDVALKASGAYRHCNPCISVTPSSRLRHNSVKSDTEWSYRRTGSSSGSRIWGKEMEARLKVISSNISMSGEATPKSTSGRRVDSVVLVEEMSDDEVMKEWVAQVEPGVLITFMPLPHGSGSSGNDLKRIRFSREMFNKWQAQRWWAENYDRIMELYNVRRLNHQAVPLSTPSRSEDESSKMESSQASPITPPLTKEHLPRNLYHPAGKGYSSSDSLDHHYPMQARPYNYSDSNGLTSTPKLSSISGAKTETSSMDASTIRSSSSRDADRSGELSISNASDLETEWVEQDEPGVYITIRSLPGGKRELRRVRFRMFHASVDVKLLCLQESARFIGYAERTNHYFGIDFQSMALNYAKTMIKVQPLGKNIIMFERYLERYTLECGGKKTEPEYMSSTCEEENFAKYWASMVAQASPLL
ncbi:hypothetical protein ACFE04_013707 [Oxalis oulophora]